MKTNFFPRHQLPIAIFLLLGFIYVIASCAVSQLPSTANPSCSISNTSFAAMFRNNVITKDGEVKPADGRIFTPTSLCDFYKWSEQMFLWLTSPTPPSYGGGGGRIFVSPAFYGVSPSSGGNRTFVKISNGAGVLQNFSMRAAQVGFHGFPVILERKTLRLFEIVPPVLSAQGKPLVLNDASEKVEVSNIKLENSVPRFFDLNNQLILRPRAILPTNLAEARVVQKFMAGSTPILLGASGTILETEPGQADAGVLMAQNGSLVYYITTVNDVFAYYLTGAKNGDALIDPTKFPTSSTDLSNVVQYAANNSKTLVDPEAMAVEVKTSWINAAGLINPGDFITMKATVPVYTPDLANDDWTPSPTQTQTLTLALVGMHVVASVKGVPAMIWATFEHERNTPNVQYSFKSGSTTATQATDIANGNWLFCANNAPAPYNEAHMSVLSNGHLHTNTDLIFGNPYHITPSNTRRDFPFGMPPSAAASNTDIISINNNVRGMLVNGDVRQHYIFYGAVWQNGGDTGTINLTNSTMETYQLGNNCFSCHGTTTPGAVSHMFNPLLPLF